MFVKIEVFLVETLLTTLPCIFNLLFYNLLRLVIIIIMYIEMKILSRPRNFYPKFQQYVRKNRQQHLLPYNITKKTSLLLLILSKI